MELRIVLIGLLMGITEMFPGISGGTIALVAGIYDRLLYNISRLGPSLLNKLFDLGWASWWKEHDLAFMAALFGSMASAILIFANVIEYLLMEEKVAIFSFFFGLVVFGIFLLLKKIERFSLKVTVLTIIGAIIGQILISLPISNLFGFTPTSFFLAGMIATVAWIMPGISGSLILLILGVYPLVISAITEIDSLLIWLALGGVLGLYLFSNLIQMLLRKFSQLTFAFLIGLILGSLSSLWPWQITTSYLLTDDGMQFPVVQNPISPLLYRQATGADPDFVLALSAFAFGLVFLAFFNRYVLTLDPTYEDS